MQDFQDALLVTQIDRIKTAVKGYNNSLLGCAGHIDSFVRYLALHSGEENRYRAVSRFHRKITLEFCTDLWSAMQTWVVRRPKTSAEERMTINCSIFLKMCGTVQTFQEYEVDFLANIYDRVDRGRRGTVAMSDVLVALLLLSPGTSRYDKARFIYTVFDTDADGCLSSEHLLKMYCSLIINGVIARGDQLSYDADLLLGDELSLAKARRLFDYALSHPSDALDDDLCTFEEWWAILEGNDRMLEDLMPGLYNISWVLRPGAGASRFKKTNEAQKKQVTVSNPKKGAGWTLLKQAVAAPSVSPAGDSKIQNLKEKLNNNAPRRKANFAPGVKGGSNQASPSNDLRRPAIDTAEKFRVHTAIRFRHAVRGEWDAVKSLNYGPPGSAEDYRQFSSTPPTRLPSLGSSVEPSSREQVQRAALWETEVGSFTKRQKNGNWHDNHKDTISDWSQAQWKKPKSRGRGSSGQGFRRMGGTQSLPNLHKPASSLSVSEIESMNAARIADVAAQSQYVVDQLPLVPQRFGKTAMGRIRNVSQVRASGGEVVDESSALTSVVSEQCKLCNTRHSVLKKCDP